MKNNPYLPEMKSRNWIHVIWTTKDQMPRLPLKNRKKLYGYLRAKCEENHIYLDVLNGTSNHLHMLVMMNPKQALAEMIHMLKASSEQYLKESYLWDKNYRAYSISTSKIPYVRRQILRQSKIHLNISLEQELWELEPLGTVQECIIVGRVVGLDE